MLKAWEIPSYDINVYCVDLKLQGRTIWKDMSGHIYSDIKTTHNDPQCQNCGLDLNNYITLFEHTRTNHTEELSGRIIIHPTSTEHAL